MMTWIGTYLQAFWSLTAEMAPYLLLGFFIAGLMHLVLTPEWVQRHLGGKGLGQSVKASVLGIPLPLCSCGVIPVSAAIRRQGGSRGAVASFTASTPQTGVDSIFATYAMLGGFFTLIRVIAAFVSGVLAGVVVDRFGSGRSAIEVSEAAPQKSCCGGQKSSRPKHGLGDGLRFAFVTLPGDIARSLLIGLAVAALISALIPTNYIAELGLPLVLTYAAITLAAVPLYVCSTGSIPMAFALVAAGVSPGAALVFLITGPATNAATLTALSTIIGRRDTLLYLASIVAVAWLGGAILDQTGAAFVTEAVHHHEPAIALWKHLSAILLLAIIGWPLLRPLLAARSAPAASCCGGGKQSASDGQACCCEKKNETCCCGTEEPPKAEEVTFSFMGAPASEPKKSCCQNKGKA